MRIFEITPVPRLDEEISVVQYEPVIKQAVYAGIIGGMKILSSIKGSLRKEEAALLDGQTVRMFSALRSFFPNSLAITISHNLELAIKREFGKDFPITVAFEQTDANTAGGAVDSNIELSTRFTMQMAGILLTEIENALIDSYDIDDRVDGLFSMFKMLGSEDRQLTRDIIWGPVDMQRLIDGVVSTTLHELVHVIQHHRQLRVAGRSDTEYRSFLGNKGEFISLHGKDNKTSAEVQRHYHLYRASPQEIAAFSQEMALQYIRDVGDFTEVNADDLLHAVGADIKSRYGNPENRNEYAVYKRYVKSVYQELRRHLESKEKTLPNLTDQE